MKRRSLFLVVCAGVLGALLMGSVAAQPVEEAATPNAALTATVVASLADVPSVDAAGAPYEGYVILIPTHDETRATPDLLLALARYGAQSRSPAFFIGNPATGEFDQEQTDAAIQALNQGRPFGLERSGGAILLLTRGPLTNASDWSVFVARSNDPAQIARRLRPRPGVRKFPEDPLSHVCFLWIMCVPFFDER